MRVGIYAARCAKKGLASCFDSEGQWFGTKGSQRERQRWAYPMKKINSLLTASESHKNCSKLKTKQVQQPVSRFSWLPCESFALYCAVLDELYCDAFKIDYDLSDIAVKLVTRKLLWRILQDTSEKRSSDHAGKNGKDLAKGQSVFYTFGYRSTPKTSMLWKKKSGKSRLTLWLEK